MAGAWAGLSRPPTQRVQTRDAEGRTRFPLRRADRQRVSRFCEREHDRFVQCVGTAEVNLDRVANIDPKQAEIDAEFETVRSVGGHADVVQIGPGDAVIRIAVLIGEALAEVDGQVLPAGQAQLQAQRAVSIRGRSGCSGVWSCRSVRYSSDAAAQGVYFCYVELPGCITGGIGCDLSVVRPFVEHAIDGMNLRERAGAGDEQCVQQAGEHGYSQ